MTLSERRNVVAFETFNQDVFKLFNFIAMFDMAVLAANQRCKNNNNNTNNNKL